MNPKLQTGGPTPLRIAVPAEGHSQPIQARHQNERSAQPPARTYEQNCLI
jgi:hypothetical protein